MRQTLLNSRPLHYLLLLAWLTFLIAGGLVTLSCGRDSLPRGQLVPGQEGVVKAGAAGFNFVKGSTKKKAEYDLGEIVDLGGGRTATCTWIAVRSLAPMKGQPQATGSVRLTDFEPADANDVKLAPGSTRATIFRGDGPRTVNFVCAYEIPGNVTRVATKSVLVDTL